MRAARAALVLLLALAVLAVTAAWAVPPLLDWNRYRATIAEVASRMLGQTVTIAGPVGLVLLPSPALTADQVTVGDGLLTVRALRLQAGLAPLLAGRIEPRELVLEAPRLALPWPPPPGLAMPRSWPAGLAVRIEDGAAMLGSFGAADLQASASVGETGALAVSGHGLIAGHDWSFAARLTAFGRDGSSGVDARFEGSGAYAGTSARFNGQLVGEAGGAGTLNGTVSMAGSDLSALMPAPAVAFHAQGRVTAADGLLAADDLAIDLAGAPARAAVALRLMPSQRLDLSLAIGRIDFAQWLRPLLRPPAAGAWGLPVGLDLSAEAADFAGATLRRLRCAFDLSPDAADLRELTAILPGAATIGLTGRIARGPDPGFAGEAHLEAPDLPATAGWAARAIGLDAGPAARLAHAATLSGQVVATPEQLSVYQLAGTFDGGAVEGTFALHPPPAAALTVAARLARLDLDPWLPHGLPAWSTLDQLAGGTAISLDVQARNAGLRGLALRDLAVRAEATPGRLVLHELTAGLAGARMAASGTIDHAGALLGGRLDLTADKATALGEAMAGLGFPPAQMLLEDLGAVHLSASGQGPANAIVAHAELDAAGGRLVADPVLDAVTGGVLASVSVTHSSAAALAARLGWLPAGNQAWLGAGPLALQASINMTPGQLAADRLEVRAGALQARAALRADWLAPLPRLTGRIAAATLPLPWLRAADTDPLPFGLLNGWEAALDVSADRLLVGLVPVASDVSARLGVAEGVLGVGGLTARIGGGELTASAAIDGAAAPPTLQADLSLKGAVIDGGLADSAVDVLSGTAAARLLLTATGYSLPALRATLQGSAALDVTHGMLRGVDLAQLREALMQAAAAGDGAAALSAALAPALAGGRTAFETLHAAADLSSGGLTLRGVSMSSPSGQATASGVIGLGADGIDVRLGLRPAIAGGPEVGLRLNGPAAAPTRMPELGGVLRWLSHS